MRRLMSVQVNCEVLTIVVTNFPDPNCAVLCMYAYTVYGPCWAIGCFRGAGDVPSARPATLDAHAPR